ncbi:MAG: TIGR01210 family radical SAM protein [Promethearchaeota archaeon]|nr:MAG: TIGR01210 family radical SAM protein [Candidatus Lokiarchaeota archaeon]
MKNFNENSSLITKIKQIRKKFIEKRAKGSNLKLEKPVSYWIKEDRLLNSRGKEFTIILRTKGCSWALGGSGGCSMCGYIGDSNIDPVDSEQIIHQFDYAMERKENEIKSSKDDFVLKIFNSGSFFDDDEISENVRTHIYDKIKTYDKIKEIVVESRVEYLRNNKLEAMQKALKDKYVEIAIGLESVDDHIRNNYVNKGLLYHDFLEAVELCKKYNLGVRVYLLFKPPFLNEQAAIDDCINSVNTLINLQVNTISINPINIQKGSYIEYLWYQNRYRPPWFYSLIKALRKILLSRKEGINTRIISDPSGAGTKRGIHNCLKRECNENMLLLLRKFVLTQNGDELSKDVPQCECKLEYKLKKLFI